jgi:hypothetical protein
LHWNEHALFTQLGVALLLLQMLLQAPQLVTLAVKLLSQPSES